MNQFFCTDQAQSENPCFFKNLNGKLFFLSAGLLQNFLNVRLSIIGKADLPHIKSQRSFLTFQGAVP